MSGACARALKYHSKSYAPFCRPIAVLAGCTVNCYPSAVGESLPGRLSQTRGVIWTSEHESASEAPR